MTQASRHLRRIAAFGSVGLAATLVHLAAFSLWIELAGLSGLAANLLAYLLAFAVSYLGHFHWTFRDRHAGDAAARRESLPRFLAVSLAGLTLNSLFAWGVVDLLRWPYPIAAALMVTVTPGLSYLASHHWAFRTSA